MALKSFFTNPDADLYLESSIDPMGHRVIWTYYAHKIFNNRITTIANDIRVYSINLFHHCIVYELFQDRAQIFELAANFKNTKLKKGIERELKQGMVVCLENLAILSFVEKDSEIDSLGIPGSRNAKAKLNNRDEIYLAVDRYAEILKNQVNLGMAGRYVGPMAEMGLFRKGFDYNDTEMQRLSEIFSSDDRFKELKETLKKFILGLFKSDHNSKRPEISFTDLKRKYTTWSAIRDGYGNCFGSRKVWKKLRVYFLNNLGLNKGAASAIYEAIDIIKYKEGIPAQDFSLIFSEAKARCVDEIERSKIDDILKIAPILSHSEYMLRKLADPGTDSIDTVKKDIELVKNELDRLWQQLPFVENKELNKLKKAINIQVSFTDLANLLVAYHTDVMKKRGGQPWLSTTEELKVKHLFAPLLYQEFVSAGDYIRSNYWYHHYYLNTLLGFKKSLS